MADGDPEEFAIEASAPIGPSAETEGTNAARFAVLGALTTPVPGVLGGAIGPVAEADVLDRLGLGRLVEPVYQGLQSSDDTLSMESSFLLGYRDTWQEGGAREAAWAKLAEGGQGRARLMLLAAGTCSELERESVTAAVALHGVVRESTGWDEDRRAPWDLRLFSRWRDWDAVLPWANPLSPMGDGFLEEMDAGPLPPTTVPWDGPRWREASNTLLGAALEEDTPAYLLTELDWLALRRIWLGLRSPDVVTRELAHSANLRAATAVTDAPGDPVGPTGDGTDTVRGGPGGPGDPSGPGGAGGSGGSGPAPRPPGIGADLATMIHGTFAWKGDWWYPSGDFHAYIKHPHRPRLYDGGMEYSWSGAYSLRQRETAGDRFLRWTQGASPTGLGTVFAHSYGGEVAARAINRGAKVRELVLLSAPVNQHHIASIAHVDRVVDIRLDFDLVLWLAAAHQRMATDPKVRTLVIPGGFWRHGATHDPGLWARKGIAAQVDL